MRGRGWLALAVLGLSLLGAAPAAVDRFDTVVIDAGHGGDDHGAEGPSGLLEKDLVLDVARRLRHKLEGDGLRVVMTRDRDVYVPLQDRADAANQAHGDLFLSIHANAAPSRVARGIETFFVSLEASDESAQRLASRENAAFAREAAADHAEDPVAAILGDLVSTEHLVESDEFARLAHRELAAIDPAPVRGVKQAPFHVLMGVQMAASLVEIGFVTNPKEERALATPARQEEIAAALATAVREFRRRWDARRGLAGAPAPSGAGPAGAAPRGRPSGAGGAGVPPSRSGG